MTRVAIIGDGGWGTALALTLWRAGRTVRVWGPFPDYVKQVRRNRENVSFLPGIRLPEEICWTADRAECVAGAEVVVMAVPTRYYREVALSFRGLVPAGALGVSVSKGLDAGTHERMTEVAEAVLGLGPVAALSGPSHAEEVARTIPTAVVVACRDGERGAALQELFRTERFRVYTSDDVIGVELGGALKNVMALAVGVSDGLGFGANTRAALITRGLAEMTRLGTAMGARPETFSGLSGMGDLVVTCTSRLSRNHAVGERLGRGETMTGILAGMKQVAEGVWNCRTACELALEAGVDMPITREVEAVVHGGKDPRAAVESLLGRAARPEADE